MSVTCTVAPVAAADDGTVADAWRQLGALYAAVGVEDVVAGIAQHQTSIPGAQRAPALEAVGRTREAGEGYRDALAAVTARLWALRARSDDAAMDEDEGGGGGGDKAAKKAAKAAKKAAKEAKKAAKA